MWYEQKKTGDTSTVVPGVKGKTTGGSTSTSIHAYTTAETEKETPFFYSNISDDPVFEPFFLADLISEVTGFCDFRHCHMTLPSSYAMSHIVT